jgi:hypothetical protein
MVDKLLDRSGVPSFGPARWYSAATLGQDGRLISGANRRDERQDGRLDGGLPDCTDACPLRAYHAGQVAQLGGASRYKKTVTAAELQAPLSCAIACNLRRIVGIEDAVGASNG